MSLVPSRLPVAPMDKQTQGILDPSSITYLYFYPITLDLEEAPGQLKTTLKARAHGVGGVFSTITSVGN